MRPSLLVIVLVTFALCATASSRAGAADEPPCLADAKRLCTIIPGELIQPCLESHADDLSTACRERIDRLLEDQHKLVDSCRYDAGALCSDVDPMGGKVVDCLVKNKDRLTAKCKQALADVSK